MLPPHSGETDFIMQDNERGNVRIPDFYYLIPPNSIIPPPHTVTVVVSEPSNERKGYKKFVGTPEEIYGQMKV